MKDALSLLVVLPPDPAPALTELTSQLERATTTLALTAPGPSATYRTVEARAEHLSREIGALNGTGSFGIIGGPGAQAAAYHLAVLLLGRDLPVNFLGLVLLDPANQDRREDPAGHHPHTPLPIPVDLFVCGGGEDARANAAATYPWIGALVPQNWVTVESRGGPNDFHLEPLADAILAACRARGSGRSITTEGRSASVPLKFGDTTQLPLFCLPGAGASILSYADLATSLDSEWSVRGLEPRGLCGKEVPHSSVAAAADHYLEELRKFDRGGAVHLLGHSFGGWVAFELAVRRLAKGRPVASLTLLDTRPPHDDPQFISEYTEYEAFLAFVEVFELIVGESLGLASAHMAAVGSSERLRSLHKSLVAHRLLPERSTPDILTGPFRVFGACLRTTYVPSSVYSGSLNLVLVPDSRISEAANHERFRQTAAAWRRWSTSCRLSIHQGNHMTALRSPLVDELAALITSLGRGDGGVIRHVVLD